MLSNAEVRSQAFSVHKPEINCACVSWGNTSWLWVTQTSTSYRYPCLLVWFWTGHLMSLITCFFTSRVEMTILLHHRAVWKVTWDKTCTDTYMRVAQFSSVTQSCPTLCDPMDTRPPCPSPTPGAYSNSCPSSRWCHPTISSSVVPFSSCLQSFPASGSFPMRQLFPSGAQSFGASASASVLPVNIQDWSPLGCTGWISLQSKGLSRVFSNTTSILRHSVFFTVQL